MTEILCNWLNNEVKLTQNINNENFAESFSNGFLIGEILSKYNLFDDLDKLADKNTADTKLKNLIILEPTMKLLGVPFNNEIANGVMSARNSVLVDLMYELFIILDRNKKSQLTALSIKSMQAPATTKLQEMESNIFQQRLTKGTSRQSDLNLQKVIEKYHGHQQKMQEKAERDRILSAEGHKHDTEMHRQSRLNRSKEIQRKQEEQQQKIEAAIVQIPKQPPNKTLAAIEKRKKQIQRKEAEKAMKELEEFEKKKSLEAGKKEINDNFDVANEDTFSISTGGTDERNLQRFGKRIDGPVRNEDNAVNREHLLEYLKLGTNEQYVGKIRSRLESDKEARIAREKRRRKVIMNCLNSHHEQEENERNNMVAMRLMRQSQMERRIAVQLLQLRHEKDIIKSNRMERERQYQERREKEFNNAMDKEKEMIRQIRLENEDNLRAEQQLYNAKKAQYIMMKYKKHYEMAEKMIYDIVDISFKYKEFQILTEGNIPKKLITDWKTAFIHGVPIFDNANPSDEDQAEEDQSAIDQDEQNKSPISSRRSKPQLIQIQDVEVPVPTPFSEISSRVDLKNKLQVLDNEDFLEYQQSLGEWMKEDVPGSAKPIPTNIILDYIIDRMVQLSQPVDESAKLNGLPEFPIKAAVVGKCFSGKSTVIENLVKNNRCQAIVPQVVINEALEAYSNEEEVEIKIPIVAEASSSPAEVEATKIDEDRTENLITDVQLNSSANEVAPTQTEEATTTSMNADTAAVATLTSAGQPIDGAMVSTLPMPEQSFELRMEPSPRAQLGQLVNVELMNGRPVNDGLLVDLILEYIRRIPQGTGWILDDFPATYQQAKLFEQAVAATNPSSVESGRDGPKSRASSRKNRTPAPPKDSLFDVVILLDTSDNECLARALACSEKQLAEETNISTINTSKDVIANLQTSLSKFSENWPKLSKFYSNIRENIIKSVSSSESFSSIQVYLKVESILDELIVKKFTPVLPPTEMEEHIEIQCTPEIETPKTDFDIELGSKEVLTSKRSGSKKKSKGSSKGSSRGSSAGSKKSEKKSNSRKSRSKSKAEDSSKSLKKVSGDKKSASKDTTSKKKGSGKSSKSSSRSGSGKGRRKTKTSVESAGKDEKKEEVTPTIDSPEPGDPDWIYVEKKIDQEISKTLSEYWDNINEVYAINCKQVFREIRFDREEIIRYIHAIRSAFRQFLDRPDAKQEYLDQFQKEFNELVDEWREDEEVQQEWHQKINELKEELFEISQENQQSAEGELEKIRSNVWLEDKIGLLSNEYINLVQHELDRYQDVVKLIRDYYKSMMNKSSSLDEFKPEFLRLPIIQIPVETESNKDAIEETESQEKYSPKPATPVAKKSLVKAGAKTAIHTDGSGELDEETESMFQTKIPVMEYKTPSSQIMSTTISNMPVPAKPPKQDKGAVTAASTSNISLLKLLTSGKSEKKGADKSSANEREAFPAPSDPDAKLLYDVAMCCFTLINGITEFEISQSAPKEDTDRSAVIPDKGGKDAKKDGDKKGGKGGKKSRTPTPKKGSKDKDKTTSAKKGKSRSPSGKSGKGKGKKTPDKDNAASDKDSEESAEEKEFRLFLERAKSEYLAALQKESQVVRYNVDRITRKGIKLVESLKLKVENTFKLISVWISDKLLTEDASIKNVESVLRYHIEIKQPIKEKMEIIKNKFFLNPVKEHDEPLVIETVASPIDSTGDNYFSVAHLKQLYQLFYNTAEANNDSLSLFDFSRILSEFITGLILQATTNSSPANSRTDNPVITQSATAVSPANEMHGGALDKLPRFLRQFIQQTPGALQALSTTGSASGPNAGAKAPLATSGLEMAIYNSGIAELFSCDKQYVNWRLFMLAATEPWPWPSQYDLLATLARFRQIDQLGRGFVTRQQYEFIDLWFDVELDTDESININRNLEIKNLFFDTFKELPEESQELSGDIHQMQPEIELLNYENMLVHFAVFTTHNFYHGIARALSVYIGNHVTTNFPVPNKESGRDTEAKIEDLPLDEEDVSIPINALYKIFSFGHSKPKLNQLDFNKVDLEDTESERDASLIKSLKNIYENCDIEDQSLCIPFSRLLMHEGLWEWFQTCHWYHYVDLRGMFVEMLAQTNIANNTPVE